MPFIHYVPASPEECCDHPEHDPPAGAIAPGVHTYQCPNCKTTKQVVIRGQRYKPPVSTSPYRPTDNDYFRRLQEGADRNRRTQQDFDQFRWRPGQRPPDQLLMSN